MLTDEEATEIGDRCQDGIGEPLVRRLLADRRERIEREAELREQLAMTVESVADSEERKDCGLTDEERAAWAWERGPECRLAARERAAQQDRPAPLRVGQDCARCDAESTARTLASTRARLAESEAREQRLRAALVAHGCYRPWLGVGMAVGPADDPDCIQRGLPREEMCRVCAAMTAEVSRAR